MLSSGICEGVLKISQKKPSACVPNDGFQGAFKCLSWHKSRLKYVGKIAQILCKLYGRFCYGILLVDMGEGGWLTLEK